MEKPKVETTQEKERDTDKKVLEIKDLKKEYGKNKVLKGIDFE